MTEKELHQKLTAPFPPDDVGWRVSTVSRDRQSGLAVPYVTSRAIQNRLDGAVGPFGWRTRFLPWHQYIPKPGKYDKPEDAGRPPVCSQLCGLSIYMEARQEWIEKVDGAENTDVETIKGGLSDSFKRAAVLWGVGRYLYRIAPQWSPIDEKKQLTNTAALRQYYEQQLDRLGLGAAQERASGADSCALWQVDGLQPAPVNGYPAAAWVSLRTPEGRTLQAFTYGQKPGLARGCTIRDAKLVQKSGAGGTYYELQDHQPAA